MAHLHKKIKKGRPYYYIREIKRVNGKPKVVSQIYLGTPEGIAKRYQEAAAKQKPWKIQSRAFGSLFVLHEMEKALDTIGIIDRIIPRVAREKGPTIGEYFFYAWANRLIDPKSKRALPAWYQHTAIQEIRPVATKELTSQKYWEKWDRVRPEDVEEIGRVFFEKIWKMQPLPPECLLFDTTNYYTFLSSRTPSELCERGHNKAGRHHLRQLGLALLVDRSTHLPLFHRIYEGNKHDSSLFRQVIDEMFGVMCGFNQTKQRLTVVFDKGMNCDEAMQTFDDETRIHFVTTYSTYFAEELAGVDIGKFSPLDTAKNRDFQKNGRPQDKMLAFRTRKELWGQERTVVVTYNPRTARKRQYTQKRKLESLREGLLEFRTKYRDQQPHWRDLDAIRERYMRMCEKLHIGSQYYQLDFGDLRKAPDMSFRKDHYQVSKSEDLFGKNIIVTDNHDWTTDEIVQSSLDRYGIEKQFRASKSKDHVRVNPLFHWTDGKIRCHLLTCVMALTVLQLLAISVNQPANGEGPLTGRAVLEEMSRLHSVLLWYPGKRKATRVLETPTELQIEVLKRLGWVMDGGGVLQKDEE